MVDRVLNKPLTHALLLTDACVANLHVFTKTFFQVFLEFVQENTKLISKCVNQ